MAFRSRSLVLLSSTPSPDPSAAYGLRGLLQKIRARVTTGKLLRPDVEDDVLRLPVEQSKFRYPSPGAQPTPLVPQGKYENVFDITYHRRDSRRKYTREDVAVEDAKVKGLPPSAGRPPQSKFLGLAADFDRQ